VLSRGYYAHASSQTGLQQLVCPIVGVPTGASTLELVYYDSDGAISSTFVRATLYRVGDFDDSATMIASVMSNSSAATDYNALQTVFAHTIDISTGSYYVIVDLSRTSAFRSARLRAVRLY
jgi:hypothetical protein